MSSSRKGSPSPAEPYRILKKFSGGALQSEDECLFDFGSELFYPLIYRQTLRTVCHAMGARKMGKNYTTKTRNTERESQINTDSHRAVAQVETNQ